MIDPQHMADHLRDLVADAPALHRLGVEVLWVAASGDALTLRARHRDRVLTLDRDGGWAHRPPAELASELASELVAEALGTGRPTLAPPRWRRSRTRPNRRS